MRLSYADFSEAFGGAWSDRLQITAYPACFVETPDLPECSEGVELPLVNDPATQTVRFTTLDSDQLAAELATSDTPSPATYHDAAQSAGATQARTVALTTASAPSIENVATSSGGVVYSTSAGAGNFGAAPLSPSAGWQVGTGSGDFSYSYPFTLPAAQGGQTPDLALNYSSGAVDAMSLAENGQASQVGIGWDLSTGYVTREYASCADDGLPAKGDLCWKTRNGAVVDGLTMVLNGHSSPLVRIGTSNNFRMLDDQGWKIELVTGGPVANSDNDDEAFKVTTTDGTVYWFGYGNGSGSTLTVPVYGNDSGEPCHQAATADSWCQQAWKWSLDRVVDTSNNEIDYTYARETNYYARFASTASDNRTQYDRAGYLTKIEYGFDRGVNYPLARQVVTVDSVYRCNPKLTDVTASCSGADGPTNRPAIWPDVPSDLICGDTGTCTVASPSFFSLERYYQVSTATVAYRGADRVTRTVDQYTLMHTMPDPDGDTGKDNPDLWLNAVVHSGVDGGSTVSMPWIRFNGDAYQNRVVVPSGEGALMKFRIGSVRNELGGRTEVVYGHAPDRQCTPAYVDGLSRFASNRECFPQKYARPGDTPHWEWFNKYVVTRIGLGDEALGYELSQTSTTASTVLGQLRVYDYDYRGEPGWRYVDDPNLPDDDETWDDWRGYAETYVHTRRTQDQQLTPGDESVRRIVQYRGLDGGRADNDPTHRLSVHIETQENSAASEPADSAWLQGQVAEETLLNPGDGGWITRSYHAYDGIRTVVDADGRDARIVYEPDTRTYTHLANGGTRTHEIQTQVDHGADGSEHRDLLVGTITQVHDLGDPDDSTDPASCVETTWKHNDTDWMRAPSTATTHDGGCAGDIIAKTQNFYDQQEDNPDLPFNKGRITDVRTWKSSGSDPSNYIDTQTDYDSYGRVTRTRDAKSNWTDVAYDAPDKGTISGGGADGLITQITTVQHNTSGGGGPDLTTVTDLDPRRGQPTQTTDPNGKKTTADYDPLGRLTDVTYPGAANTSVTYNYTIAADAPSRIQTRTLRSGATYDESYSFVDGWGRTIETQVRQPEASADERIVTATGYDDQGLARYSIPAAPNGNTVNPFGTVLNAAPGDVDRYTVTDYDAAGRPVRDVKMNQNTTVATTWTKYDGDAVRVNPDDSGPTKTNLDAWGRPTSVQQFLSGDGTSASSGDPEDRASYSYDPLGRLTTITKTLDGTDRTWSYSFDWAGRRTKAVDPDTGTTTYTYDDNGNLTRSAGPAADTTTAYDGLNRPTKRTRTSDGTSLADWKYDTTSNGLGRLTSSTSHTVLGDFTTAAQGYDARGNPTGTVYTVPGAYLGATTSTATVSVGYGYNEKAQVNQVDYPAVGPLGHRIFDIGYAKNGAFSSIYRDSLTTFRIADASYDKYGNAKGYDSTTGGTETGNTLNRNYAYETATGRLNHIAAMGPSGTTFLQLDYAFDHQGNPTHIDESTTIAGSTTSTGYCYNYDGLNRLSRARKSVGGTATARSTCTTTSPGYDLTYGYAKDRLKTVGITGSTTNTYSYDASHPHQTTGINGATGNGLPATGTLGYDTAGRIQTWTPTTGAATNYSYDATGQLQDTTATINSARTRIRNAYDPDGLRVARETVGLDTNGNPTGQITTVLYLGDIEVTSTKASPTTTAAPTITARRDYQTPGGVPLAIEDGQATGVNWTWLTADAQQSVRLARNPTTATLTTTTTASDYLPYGTRENSKTITAVGERGYLDKTEDPNGALRLDHRTYDPNLDILTTPDPLLDPLEPATLNPYAYARNNPNTFADPSGEMAQTLSHGGPPSTAQGKAQLLVDQAQVGGAYTGPLVTQSEATNIAAGAVSSAATVADLILLGGSIFHPVSTASSYLDDQLGVNQSSVSYHLGEVLPFIITPGGEAEGAEAFLAVKADASAGKAAARMLEATGPAAKSESAIVRAGETCLNSFTGTTPVLMADGSQKAIKEVELGDKVMATDPETGKTGPRKVIDLIRHSGPHTMVAVRLSDGSTIDATDRHPFWDESRDAWVDAIDLLPGDGVVTADGGMLVVESLGISEQDLTAYNLTVAGLHTYYAGAVSVLVHNSGGMGGCSDAAYQGVLHLRDEIVKEGAGGVHSWAAKMSDDAVADYLDGFVTRGGGQALKGGGVGWYDAERGLGIIQRNEYSMTGYSMSYDTFLGKLR